MGWIGCLGDFGRVCDEDVKVSKIVYKTYDGKFFAPQFYDNEYKLGETYEEELSYSYSEEHKSVEINDGIHCYINTNKIVRENNFMVEVYDNTGFHVYTWQNPDFEEGHPLRFAEIWKLNCVIPKGTVFYILDARKPINLQLMGTPTVE